MKKIIFKFILLVMLINCIPLNIFAKNLESKQTSTNPKVSVIAAVYNVEPYLKDCMDSLVNQTLKEIEIICIDDCSTDNSLNILREYAEHDSRVKVIRQSENKGAYAARNIGLENAAGEYVGFVDPDDYVELTTFETAYNNAKNNKADITVFGGETFGQKDNFASKVLTTNDEICINDSINALFDKNGSRPYIWNKIYKRELLLRNNIRFEEERNGCDNVFCFYVFPVANKISFIHDKLYHYRIGRPNNAGNEIWKDKIKSLEMSIKTNRYIIKRWLDYGYVYEAPKKFIKHYINLYFNKISYLKLSLKANYSKKVFDEIFINKFLELINKENISDNLIKKINRLKYLELSDNYKRVRKDYNYYKNLNPARYKYELRRWFKEKTGTNLNLDDPKTFNEKIQWLKIYDSTPQKTRLADKYLVREYVKEKIGEKYLVPLLGVYDSFDEIDFDSLPDKFVIKCNHGCGWNVIVTNKSTFDKSKAKKKFDKWMKMDYSALFGMELHYKNITPKIIIEEYLENENQDLYDYKVWCNNGNPEYIMFLSNRKNKLEMSFYDTDWNLMPFYYSHPQHEKLHPKPKDLEKLLELSKKLAEGFSYVRVDFYILNDGSIKFGEMTFTSCSGVCRWNDDKYDKMLGDKITLPLKKYDYHNIFKNQ